MVVRARLAAVAVVVSAGLVRGVEAQQCCTGNVSTYCTAGTSVQGCVPSIAGVGIPSASALTGFDIVVDNVPTQKMGLVFYGMNAIPQPQPWALGSTSYLCIYYPVNRTGAHSSGGALGACDGELRVDFNSWRATNPAALGSPFAGGQALYAQGWFRDPGAAKHTNLSDGLQFVLCSARGDLTPPVIASCGPDVTVSADANCHATIPDLRSGVAAVDDCSQVSTTQLPAAGTVVGLGSTNVMVIATDQAGNQSQCNVVVNVLDHFGPVLVGCPAAVTLPATSACQAAVPDFLSGVSATDVCSGVLSIQQSPAAGAMVGLGRTFVAITASDTLGNSSTCAVAVDVVNSPSCYVPLGLIQVQPGAFLMGSNTIPGSGPAHQVTITYQYWIGATEVSQAQYSALMGTNPSYWFGANRPVDQASWYDAMSYCAAFTAQQALLNAVPSGYQYRLPTEAEWEYACRAGTTTAFNFGNAVQCGQAQLNVPGCPYPNSTAPVGSYLPNGWGLYDTHGNVWEWCLDSYASYSAGAATNPFVTGGPTRVIRSASWQNLNVAQAQSAARDENSPSFDGNDEGLGFRVVLAPILVP